MPRDRPADAPYTPRSPDKVLAYAKAHKARKAADAALLKANTVAQIALDHLRIETLETRNSDRLDFHERGVESIKAALEAAYAAGLKAGGK